MTKTITKTLLATACFALLAGSALARNFAVPSNDPAVTVSVPDSWKSEEIEYGYSAFSPGKDVFFSVEYAGSKNLDAMMKNNEAWMKENEIDTSIKPQEREMDFNGIKGTAYRFDTKDASGPTRVDFVLLPGGKNRVVMLTLWGSSDERTKHSKEVESIMSSVKPIQ